MPNFELGTAVLHLQHGRGEVLLDRGATVVVRFSHGIEECDRTTLSSILTTLQAIEQQTWDNPIEVMSRILAEAIESVNSAWGVFSRSRIALLPHQLWVCKKVIEKWPARWLVADDVGLGKTIEAGLILWPLIAGGKIKRLLVLCPASLVGQWQYRMRTMFDIRLAQYVTEADTARGDFWGTHNFVVASLQTLRLDSSDRHERLFESDPWDLIVVDEAHHLNADEQGGPTLGYDLIKRFVDLGKATSMVFFTGTPHRGKDYGFISLLRLLRPELFSTDIPLRKQLSYLRDVMIRNNKQSVVDLKGNKLFSPPKVTSETYEYSSEESSFYDMLTEFISSGKAYASSLEGSEGRAVMLVLIAMQKLASSSVAAIRSALSGRLQRIRLGRKELARLKSQEKLYGLQDYENLEKAGDIDSLAALEERIAELSVRLRLMQDEEPRLEELVTAAEKVKDETKIKRILTLVEERFVGEPILFFTEYKATQSLLMSNLIEKFGDDCVTFINGDNRAENVRTKSGTILTLSSKREDASESFNSGKVRFLVSTEAGGEGIDLQERCHSLIHVDLPWNPMRLHQRVGRLNRYGQKQQVQVLTLRNPSTVESLIWDKLNEKINNIMVAFDQVMEEHEDLLQLVLGMTSPSLFREIFSQADSVSQDTLSTWFNQKTASFGGKEVVNTVKDLVGNCAKFDFQETSSQIPRVDLPDLKPFFISTLKLNRKKIKDDETGLSFKTPENWAKRQGILGQYEGMRFERIQGPLQKILGVGHRLFDEAIAESKASMACAALIPKSVLNNAICIFRIRNRITDQQGAIQATIGAVEVDVNENGSSTILRDWELLQRLNSVVEAYASRRSEVLHPVVSADIVKKYLSSAQSKIEANLLLFGLPFQRIDIEPVSVLWPLEDNQELK